MPERFRKLLLTMGGRASFIRLLVVAVGIVVVFGILNPTVFLSGQNLQYVELASPEVAILSLAMALTMLTAGIDLSVVSIANLSGVVAALIMTNGHQSPGLAMLAGIGVALACGAVNGLLVGYKHVPPILATLATGQLFSGLALVASSGTVVKGLPESFTRIALLTVAGVPLIFWVMLIVAVIIGVVVAKTPLGFRMRLVGANPTAADFSGIRRARVLLATYVMSGALGGVAGLIISARAGGANSDYGSSYVLLAVVIAVLAGVDPEGGYLTVAGVVIAAIAMQLLGAGLLSLSVSSHVVNICQGLLLVTMVLLNTWGTALSGLLPRRRVTA
ncbi:ABC transporter permease [Kribbella sp. NBC_01505]|uniref:ABC transporter permease n=1 Tax=Kribbella sp. NBC_01505 TaxID=2903580 RepID=UPI003863CA3A